MEFVTSFYFIQFYILHSLDGVDMDSMFHIETDVDSMWIPQCVRCG